MSTVGRASALLSFRISDSIKKRAKAVATLAYDGNLSELLIDALMEKIEKVEKDQRKLLESALHLSYEEAEAIAKEVENPSKATKAFIDFMNMDHLDHEELEKRLNANKNRQTR